MSPAKSSDRIEVRSLARAGLPTQIIIRAGRTWHRQLRLAGSVSIVIMGSNRMRQLNRKWRGQDRAADVLSFGSVGVGRRDGHPIEAGEIFLCPEVIRRHAFSFERTYREHLLALLRHGLLHIAGYRHRSASEQSRWNRRERQLSVVRT